MSGALRYLVYLVEKALADVTARALPVLSTGVRRRILRGRPTALDERIRLIDTMTAANLDISDELAELEAQFSARLISGLRFSRDAIGSEARFLGFVLERLRQGNKRGGYAQLFQDYWVLYELGCMNGGYFVEFGALDGITLSNTYLLEQEFAWTGILAEPNPRYTSELRENRSCVISNKCVWSASGQDARLVLADELSTIAKFAAEDGHAAERLGKAEVVVETISLMDLLEEARAPRTIDLLSIDTEGSEFEILRAFDFSAYRIRCICVEHNFTKNRQDIYELLSRRGYQRKLERVSCWDDWYVLRQA